MITSVIRIRLNLVRLCCGELRLRILQSCGEHGPGDLVGDIGLAQLRFGEIELTFDLIARVHKITRIDHHQQIALVDKLIVGDRKRNDATRNLRCHRDDIGTHRSVSGPGRCHVGLPHTPGEHTGERKCEQRDQDGNSP